MNYLLDILMKKIEISKMKIQNAVLCARLVGNITFTHIFGENTNNFSFPIFCRIYT